MIANLYQGVHNESLIYLKHSMEKRDLQSLVLVTADEADYDSLKKLIGKERESKIVNTLNHLPEPCRTIFRLRRFENLKYHQVAIGPGLSKKTVENKMGKAMKKMRIQLAVYLPLLLFVSSIIFHQNLK